MWFVLGNPIPVNLTQTGPTSGTLVGGGYNDKLEMAGDHIWFPAVPQISGYYKGGYIDFGHIPDQMNDWICWAGTYKSGGGDLIKVITSMNPEQSGYPLVVGIETVTGSYTGKANEGGLAIPWFWGSEPSKIAGGAFFRGIIKFNDGTSWTWVSA